MEKITDDVPSTFVYDPKPGFVMFGGWGTDWVLRISGETGIIEINDAIPQDEAVKAFISACNFAIEKTRK